MIGLAIIVSTMVMNRYVSSDAGIREITVDSKQVTETNNGFRCELNDDYSQRSYFYEKNSQKEVEQFCAQFEIGEQYEIQFHVKSGQYYVIHEKDS
ncbi:hypothetical protein LCL95_01595 [Bacillus timonensis]|nr:hypothetical protein [Bacillus timonensis]